ncbi:MAG: hypothetical protein WC565_08765 [Parcubacteria group bacterium]
MAADVVYVVDNGLAITTDRLLDSPTHNPPKWVHWGTGTTAATGADTVLETPGAEARAVGTVTQQTTTHTNDTLQVVGTLTCAGAGKAITEAALFTHLTSTTGYLYLRATFSAINLNVGDSIQFTIKAQYTHPA